LGPSTDPGEPAAKSPPIHREETTGVYPVYSIYMESSRESEFGNTPETDPSLLTEGIDRRKAIKYGSIAAGLAIATPTILTLGASPASASGQVSNQFGGSQTAPGGTNIESTPSGLSGTGIVVISVAIAGLRLAADTVVSSTAGVDFPSNTWTLVTDSYKTATGFTTATYYTTLNGSQHKCNFKFAWTTGTRAALAGTYFPTASTVSSVVNKATPSAGTSITAPAGLVVPNQPTNKPAILFCGSMLRTGSNAPTYTCPSGFGFQGNQIYSAYGTTSATSGVGVGHSYYPTDSMWESGQSITATNSYAAVSATAAASVMNSATMICIS